MLNSKISKAAIIKSVLFIMVLALLVAVLNYILVPYSSIKQRFDRYRGHNGNIDFAFLGNSLEIDGINPEIVSKEFGEMNVCVFAPQGSYPESLYYLLLDVASKHNLKKLVCGWDIIQNFQDPPYTYPHSEELYRELMKDTKFGTKLSFLTIKNILKQRYTSTFFEYASFPENLFEIPAVLKTKKAEYKEKKLSENFAVADPKNEVPLDATKLSEIDSFDYDDLIVYGRTNKYQENDKIYFQKIRDFCRENDIDFYVISCAIPNCVSELYPVLNEAREVSATMFKELEIPYVDASEIMGGGYDRK